MVIIYRYILIGALNATDRPEAVDRIVALRLVFGVVDRKNPESPASPRRTSRAGPAES